MSHSRQKFFQVMRPAGTILAGAVVSLLGLMAISGPFIVHSLRERETAGALVQFGRAEVTGVTYRQAKESNPAPATLVHLELDGQKLTANTLAPPRI